MKIIQPCRTYVNLNIRFFNEVTENNNNKKKQIGKVNDLKHLLICNTWLLKRLTGCDVNQKVPILIDGWQFIMSNDSVAINTLLCT